MMAPVLSDISGASAMVSNMPGGGGKAALVRIASAPRSVMILPFQSANPTFPRFDNRSDLRSERREPILSRVASAFQQIAPRGGARGSVRFLPPEDCHRYIQMDRRGGLSRRLWSLKVLSRSRRGL
jgi:hypothetical protein